MQVLVIGAATAHRVAIEKWLSESAHSVSSAVNVDAAIKKIESQKFEVAIVDWATTRPSSIECLRRLRAHEGQRHIYSVVVMSEANATSVAAAFAAGADDLLRRPFIREELIARVGAVERIRRWATKLLAQNENAAIDLSKLAAWQLADREIGCHLSSFFDRRLEVRLGLARPERALLVAEIPMSVADEGIDCRLSVGIDAWSRQGITELPLFDAPNVEEAVKDMMRELANVAGGAFADAAETEGVSVTLGLPEIASAEGALAEPRGTVQEFVLAVVDTTIEVRVRISMASRELKKLKPRQLSEGMVVARDILNDEGAALVTAGTRLTESAVTRLVTLLSPLATVVVLAV